MSGQIKTLYLLRHAKSAWDTGAPDDFSRPLNARGERDASKIGQWLQHRSIKPEYVVSSPALRAWQTVMAVCHALNIIPDSIHFDRCLYLASKEELCRLIAATPDEVHSLLLVGHNPGLDELLAYLVEDELPYTQNGKLMTTASLAIVQVAGWRAVEDSKSSLLELIRPKSLA